MQQVSPRERQAHTERGIELIFHYGHVTTVVPERSENRTPKSFSFRGTNVAEEKRRVRVNQ